MRLGRLDAAGERTSINTDSQMELKMPSIRSQVDKLQGKKHVENLVVFHKYLNALNMYKIF